EALDNEDWDGLKEEMGDLLFQLAFLGRLNQEEGRFGLSDAIDCVYKKMVQRHPHVFGDEDAGNRDEVAQAWERNKLERSEGDSSVLDGVNSSLPNLVASYRMTQKAAGVGFDWASADDVVEKVREELREVEAALSEGSKRRYEEIGDLLFAVANLARHLNVDPEAALARSNLKFRRRFRFIERSLAGQKRRLTEATLAELDALWDAAKEQDGSVP
ncbi:MAG: nucleoside triphosphate pyrophosphohydrolase, partial [Proteobacteria bacterium]|nr:nucleoside triphosphate pyrophosphohydrolase [Pseudomonadota bacterium]